jgi:hypothetical protein
MCAINMVVNTQLSNFDMHEAENVMVFVHTTTGAQPATQHACAVLRCYPELLPRDAKSMERRVCGPVQLPPK